MPLTVTSSHEFQRGGSVAIEILPRPSESSCYASLNGALDFSYPVGVQVFDLLDLAPAGIAYPAEECEVTVPESWANEIISEGPVDIIVPAIPRDDAPAPEPPDQPATVLPTSPGSVPSSVKTPPGHAGAPGGQACGASLKSPITSNRSRTTPG